MSAPPDNEAAIRGRDERKANMRCAGAVVIVQLCGGSTGYYCTITMKEIFLVTSWVQSY